MNSQSTRQATLRHLPALAASLLLLLISCGGQGEEIELAQKHIRRGELDEAERVLAEGEGDGVERLLGEVRLAQLARAEFHSKVDAARALVPASESLRALRELADAAPDPISQDRLDQARSQVADRAAKEIAARPHRSVEWDDSLWEPEELIVRHSQGAVEARSEAQRAQVDLVLVSAESARARKEWELALIELAMVLPSAGSRAGEIRALARAIEEEAQTDVGEILARAGSIEEAEGDSSARSYLLRHTGRFPGAGPLSTIHDELARVTRAIGRRTQLKRGNLEVVVHEPTQTEVDDLRVRATVFEAAGDLRLAMDAWIDAGFGVDPGDERDSFVGRARALERRLLFRGEVVAAWDQDPAPFVEGGITSVNADGVGRGAEALAWRELSGDELQQLGRLGRISKQAQGGLLLERLAGGVDEDALADLGRLVKRGQMRSAEAWSLVAEFLEEEVPEGGYVYDEKQWLPRAQFEAERLAASLAKYKKELLVATAENREEALARLLDLGSAADAVIEEILLARWGRASRTVQRGGVLDSLEMVATRRRDLDRTRERALELIFDVEEYFYPYNPPECPPQRASLYPPVQRRVDKLVGAVQEVWADSRSARLPSMFLSGLDDLTWLREVAADELELSLVLQSEIPNWIWGIDSSLESIQLRTFAWDADEAFDLAMSRDLVAFNEHLWESFRPKGRVMDGAGKRADVAEAEQVRITNEYRVMMGRRAVAWNPRVQAAASMHSEYMADTGDFGHFERGDPKRRSPRDRMRLCGYGSGASENCYAGSAAPRSAHNGWLHSSGHHRNILAVGHREMASGVVGNYWTQNFGRDTGFLDSLRTWLD